MEGEKQLTPLESLTPSVAKVKEMRESLDQFLEESVVNMDLYTSWITSHVEV